jgi:hypothetical protein
MTPLDQESACRKDLCLTKYNTHGGFRFVLESYLFFECPALPRTTQTSISPAGIFSLSLSLSVLLSVLVYFVLIVLALPFCPYCSTLTTDKHPCLRRYSNPQPQQAIGRRPSPWTARSLKSERDRLYTTKYKVSIDFLALWFYLVRLECDCVQTARMIKQCRHLLRYVADKDALLTNFSAFRIVFRETENNCRR